MALFLWMRVTYVLTINTYSTNNDAATIFPIPEATSHFTIPSNTSQTLQYTDPENICTSFHTPSHQVQAQEQTWHDVYGLYHHLPPYPFYGSTTSPVSAPLHDPAQPHTPHPTHGNYPSQNTLVHAHPYAGSSIDPSAPIPDNSIPPVASSPRNSSTTSRTSSTSTNGVNAGSRLIHGIIRNWAHRQVPTDLFQPMSSAPTPGIDAEGSSRDPSWQEMQRLDYICTQCHQCVPKADHMSHYLGHSNLKERECTWACTCGKPFRCRFNAMRHVKECVPCSTCHRKIGRNGNGISCSRCLRSRSNGNDGGDRG